MTPTGEQTVEFVGGPLDGHLQAVSLTADELREMVAIPVNLNVVDKLTMPRLLPKGPATSVALYSLESRPALPRYVYLGPGAPSQFQLTSWRG